MSEARDTLVDCLLRAGERETARDGLTFIDAQEREERLSWATVRDRALRAAGALHAQGVRPGDRVVLVLPTCPQFMDAFFGCTLLGAVPVPVYPPVRLGRLEEYYDRTAAMLRAVDAVALVSDARVRRLLGQVVARARPRLGVISAEELSAGPAHAPVAARPDQLCMVQFSSGTTVDPKAVGLTHGAVLANVEALIEQILRVEPEVPGGASWLPLYHDMGLIGCLFPAVYHPGPLALISPEIFLLKPALWLRAIARHRATVSPAPNFAYGLVLERVRDEDLADVDGRGTRCDLSSWGMALNGAEPIAPRTLRAFRERFAAWGLRPEALTPVYGLSEASLAVTFSDPLTPFRTVRFERGSLAQGEARPASEQQPAERAVEMVSVGRPLTGFQVQIRSREGALLPEAALGHIHVAGPSLTSGYLNRDESPVREGWLDTGDLGFLMDGELYITGRAKDVLILRGRNHAPQEIEHAVDAVEGVRTGCAAAVAELSEEGERLLVFVEVREPTPTLAEDCRKAVLGSTGLDPGLVVLLEAGTLPRTSSGKIRRAETLRRWQSGELLPPKKVTPWLLAGALARSALGYWTGR